MALDDRVLQGFKGRLFLVFGHDFSSNSLKVPNLSEDRRKNRPGQTMGEERRKAKGWRLKAKEKDQSLEGKGGRQ
jgi:hypothetical protein